MTTNDVGNVSEAVVLAAYANAGFGVSVPFGNGCAYDLVVDIGRRLLKVQVKTGWQCQGCLLFKGQRRVRDSGYNGMRRYEVGEVDFFAVHFPVTGSIYVVPFEVMGAYGRLRVTPVLNGQRKFIRWAADFTWEKHLEQLRREACGEFTRGTDSKR
jgi:hypothetical protein